MRADMAKVIVERPREVIAFKPKGERRRLQQMELEDQGGGEGLRFCWTRAMGWDRKSSRENDKPFLRFLRKRVGQPWDEVYSEICAGLQRDPHLRRKVMEKLDYFVEFEVVMKAGKPYTLGDLPIEGNVYHSLYVHPETGILCWAPRAADWPGQTSHAGWASYWEATGSPYIKVAGKNYRRIKGTWFEVELKPVPAPKCCYSYYALGYVPERGPYDYILSESLGLLGEIQLLKAHGLKGVYAASKRQLSKREIRRLKLDEEKPGKSRSVKAKKCRGPVMRDRGRGYGRRSA